MYGDAGRDVASLAFGDSHIAVHDDDPAVFEVTTATRYDVASVTKAAATAAVVMKLDIDIDEPVTRWLPELVVRGADRITWTHLLGHASGFPAHIEFFKRLLAGERMGASSAREAILRMVGETELAYEPGTGTIYSDLGYITLGFAIERVTGQRLDRCAHELVFAPLGMTRTGFPGVPGPSEASGTLSDASGTLSEVSGTPSEASGTLPGGTPSPSEVSGTPSEGTPSPSEVSGTPSEGTPSEVSGTLSGTLSDASGTPGGSSGEDSLCPVAPTERCPYRGLVHGEVHDDNSHAAGGVTGHAGLFATAGDLARFARAVIAAERGGPAAETGGFRSDVVRRFWTTSAAPDTTWRLGWDRPSPPPARTHAGDLWPRDGVGHLGFTGCSLWLDPPRGRYVVLLTNRVHPSRDQVEDPADAGAERPPTIRELRRRVMDAVVRTLDGDE